MTGFNYENSATGYAGTERRANFKLRDVFEQAYRLAFPLMDSGQVAKVGSTTHFLRVILHDAFPDLHPQDISILSVSIERVFRERSKSGI